jgi:hypothetical protein
MLAVVVGTPAKISLTEHFINFILWAFIECPYYKKCAYT